MAGNNVKLRIKTMYISVFAHIKRDEKVAVELQESDIGKCAVLSAGELSVFINGREKLLELASLLERAAQEWESEVSNG